MIQAIQTPEGITATLFLALTIAGILGALLQLRHYK